MKFTYAPSPSPDVLLNSYDPSVYPGFKQVFEIPQAGSPLYFLVRSPEESSYAIVLENRSDKPITALRYRWLITNQNGQVRTHTVSSDSYMVDVFRAVIEASARQLISPSGSIDESLLDHVRKGGGCIGSGNGSNPPSLNGGTELTFSMDLVVFADGEIAGPDPDRYARDLRCRKPAADFIAKQIRLAEAENRDVTPVLSALAELPRSRDDALAHWIHHYARYYLTRTRTTLHSMNLQDVLRHLENRPILPKFYRREPPDIGSESSV